MQHTRILDLPIAVTDYPGAVGWILEKAAMGNRAYAVEAANTHVVALARQDPSFRDAMLRFDLILPDGMPLVWVINTHISGHQKLDDRVYGPTLMLETLKATEGCNDFRHFFLGGKPSTLDKLIPNLGKRYPNSLIAGSYSPPYGEWPEDETDRICGLIRDSGANLIWVGLGCPKQEHWIARHKDRLPHGVYFGIGAAFAFHSGEVRQAPSLLQKFGLEWVYRLAMEPRRLLRRYLTYNTLFVWHVLREQQKP